MNKSKVKIAHLQKTYTSVNILSNGGHFFFFFFLVAEAIQPYPNTNPDLSIPKRQPYF